MNCKSDELITGFGMTELAAGVLQTDPNDDLSFLTIMLVKPFQVDILA